MASTFTKLLAHFIFSTKHRDPLITPAIEPDLHAYMVGITRNLDCWTMALNGTADHVHLLISMSKKITVIDLMENVKKDSSRWLNERKILPTKFHWQDGYAAFTIGESGVPGLTRYIQGQKEHHRTITFKEELLNFLKKYKVEYDERYIWT
jgi:REP element-mobilizing transposase RayT